MTEELSDLVSQWVATIVPDFDGADVERQSLLQEWMAELRRDRIYTLDSLKERAQYEDTWKDLCDDVSGGLKVELRKWYKSKGYGKKRPRDEDDVEARLITESMKKFRSSLMQAFHTDGIDLTSKLYLRRHELEEKCRDLINMRRFVLLSAPPASGKTSLCQLLEAQLVRDSFKVEYINMCDTEDNPTGVLQTNCGIDLDLRTFPDIQSPYLIMIDDAQNVYGCKDFWHKLIKSAPSWLPSNFRFLISATHLLVLGIHSPVEFASLQRLSRKDFLIDPEEGLKLIQIMLPVHYATFENLSHILIEECCGLIGALVLCIDAIRAKFRKIIPSESESIVYFFSNEIVPYVSRCFGSGQRDIHETKFWNFLRKCFVEGAVQVPTLQPQDQKTFEGLQKSGILFEEKVGCFSFSSPLAKRFFFRQIFPFRSDRAPKSLRALLLGAIKKMSRTMLQRSVASKEDFPKQTIFQHVFMMGLAAMLPPANFICPELSRVFPRSNEGNLRFLLLC